MKIDELWPYIMQLMPYLIALAIAVISFLVYRIEAKAKKLKIKALQEALDHAKSKETYTVCPKCGEKLPLSSIQFYLPGNVKDNNLNGVPDEEEKNEEM